MLFVVAVGTLLSAMAGSMVNLALPSIGRDLGVSIESSRWVVQAFLLAVAVLLLPAGRVGDLVGHGRVYLAGFALFGATSFLCGAAGSFPVLAAGRALQGVGGAMVMATGPALLTTSFPSTQRGRALGMLATATYVGLMAGPPLAGAVVDWLSWRWVFYLMAPVSTVVLAVGLAFLPRRGASSPRGGFDWPGAAALVAGMPLVLLFLDRIRPESTPGAAGLVAGGAGAAALVAFVLVERRSASPLLDLGLFRSRVFTGAAASALANYVALFGMILLVPFYLEEALGLSSSRAGLVLTAQPFAMAISASPAGWLSDRIGSRVLATGGMLGLAGGLLGLSTVGPETPEIVVAAWLGACGLGTGVFISPNSSALMGAAPRSRQGTAGSLLAEARILGMLAGVALASTLFRAGGAQTGRAWTAVELDALALVLRVSAAVAVVGALLAALRGREDRSAR